MSQDSPTQQEPQSPVSPSAGLPEGQLFVESLDIEAQGIAHRPDGKVVFIDGALPFEVVSVLLLAAVIGGVYLAKRGGRDA